MSLEILLVKICPFCKQEFSKPENLHIANWNQKIYCSKKCLQKSYNQNNKQTIKERNQAYYQTHKNYFLQYNRRWRNENREHFNAYHKTYQRKYWDNLDPEIRKARLKEKAKIFKEKNPEKVIAWVRRWQKANPEKKKAQDLVNQYKIPVGKECLFCGSKDNLVRHHPDYSKPLEVLTLCQSCHMRGHRGL